MLVFVFLLKFLVGGGLDMIPDITRIFFFGKQKIMGPSLLCKEN